MVFRRLLTVFTVLSVVVVCIFSQIHGSALILNPTGIPDGSSGISYMPPQPGKYPDKTSGVGTDGSQKEGLTLLQMAPSMVPDAYLMQALTPDYAPAAGVTEKVLVIPIEFLDEKFDAGHNQAYFANILNGMKDYYEKNSGYVAGSHGISVDATVSAIVTSSYNMAHYGADTFGIDTGDGSSTQPIYQLAREAVQKLNAMGFDFSPYDGSDADSVIDHIFIIHAGQGQEESVSATTNIWSHAWNISPGEPIDGKVAVNYTCVPETGTMGVYAHEFGHDIGLPDLYDTNGATDGYTSGVGDWVRCQRPGIPGPGLYLRRRGLGHHGLRILEYDRQPAGRERAVEPFRLEPHADGVGHCCHGVGRWRADTDEHGRFQYHPQNVDGRLNRIR